MVGRRHATPAGLPEEKVFAQGRTLEDVWAAPFFAGVRQWQRDHGFYQPQSMALANWLMPCPMRDHHAELRQIILEYEPDSVDENAKQALLDPGHAEGLIAHAEALDGPTQPIWEEQYLKS
jgi:hypothetical protein